MTQNELILHFLTYHPFLIPAKMSGTEYIFNGVKIGFFGSELCRRCRSLRAQGLLISGPDPSNPKFTRFFKPYAQGSLL